MKAVIKFSLIVFAFAPMAYADNPQMQDYLRRERLTTARSTPEHITVAPYSHGQGLGGRRVIREEQTRDRFEVTQDSHGNYRMFYRSTTERPNE